MENKVEIIKQGRINSKKCKKIERRKFIGKQIERRRREGKERRNILREIIITRKKRRKIQIKGKIKKEKAEKEKKG